MKSRVLAEATERLAEARRLSDEATQAARAAAEEAHRQAAQLADDADQRRQGADAKVEAAEQVGRQAEQDARRATRRFKHEQPNGSLKSQTKPELLDLASGLDIDGRSNMTKAELVDAINRRTRAAR